MRWYRWAKSFWFVNQSVKRLNGRGTKNIRRRSNYQMEKLIKPRKEIKNLKQSSHYSNKSLISGNFPIIMTFEVRIPNDSSSFPLSWQLFHVFSCPRSRIFHICQKQSKYSWQPSVGQITTRKGFCFSCFPILSPILVSIPTKSEVVLYWAG